MIWKRKMSWLRRSSCHKKIVISGLKPSCCKVQNLFSLTVSVVILVCCIERREKEPRNRCIVLILYICTLERTTLTSTNSYKYLCLLTNDDNGPMSQIGQWEIQGEMRSRRTNGRGLAEPGQALANRISMGRRRQTFVTHISYITGMLFCGYIC